MVVPPSRYDSGRKVSLPPAAKRVVTMRLELNRVCLFLPDYRLPFRGADELDEPQVRRGGVLVEHELVVVLDRAGDGGGDVLAVQLQRDEFTAASA